MSAVGNKGRKMVGTGLSLCNRSTPKPNKNLKSTCSPRSTKPGTEPSSVVSSLPSTRSLRTPVRSSVRKISGSGLNIQKTMISTKTKKNKSLLTQTRKKDVSGFEDQAKGLRSHLASVAPDRHAEVRNRPCGQLSVKKSLNWDTAFFSNEGLLNTAELCMINKGCTKAFSNQKSESVGSVLRKTVDWDTAFPGEGLLNPEELVTVNKGFKKAVYENTKPTTCFSDISSGAVLSPLSYQRPPPCPKSKERKVTSQDATIPSSSGRNVMPSRLRMPSPRLGFFDEVYGIAPSSLVQVC